MAMPPKGGNSTVSMAEHKDVFRYMRNAFRL